jgi:Dna[CI] antecedent DciA-like protein
MEHAGARDVVQQLFGATPERRLALLRAAWPGAVGPELARRTEVITLDGDALRIRVPDATWRKGLLRMRRDILVRLYRVAGSLAPRQLGFVEGGGSGPHGLAEAEAPLPAAPAAPPSRALLAEAERIVEPELRARFLETAARYLDRFKPST